MLTRTALLCSPQRLGAEYGPAYAGREERPSRSERHGEPALDATTERIIEK